MNTFKYIEKMIACEISNNKLDDYFLGFRKMVNIEKKTIVIYQDMFSIDLVGFFFKSNNSKN